jgi:hypothetical protein
VLLLLTPPSVPDALAQGGQGGHAAHDRTNWTPQQKADELIRRGEELRKAVEELADPNKPCPKTPEEWARAIDVAAAWEAFKDNRKAAKRALGGGNGPLDDQTGGEQSRSRRWDKIFDGKSELSDRLKAKLAACNPPGGGLGVLQQVLVLAGEKKDLELGLVGLAPLAPAVCPDCEEDRKKREQQSTQPGGGRR